MLTAERARELFVYDPETGALTWRNGTPRYKSRAGTRAGNVDKRTGYARVAVNKVFYAAHRIAWLIMTGSFPPDQIDHINRVRDDNRWVNLRAATPSQNQQNQGISKKNTSGVTGVCFCNTRKRWNAYVYKGSKRISLGGFKTKEEAIQARMEGEKKYYGAARDAIIEYLTSEPSRLCHGCGGSETKPLSQNTTK